MTKEQEKERQELARARAVTQTIRRWHLDLSLSQYALDFIIARWWMLHPPALIVEEFED